MSILKRMLSMFLVLALLVGSFPPAAFAQAGELFDGSTAQAAAEEPVLTQPEEEEEEESAAVMPLSLESDFAIEILNGTYCQITSYVGAAARVEVPGQIGEYIVQSIGAEAFAENPVITEVILPQSIETIANGAFQNCTALTKIQLPSQVTSVGNSAFSGCISLTDVTMHSSVKAIYAYAFRDCTSLESIVIPDSVTSISSAAFERCTALKSVALSVNWSAVPTIYDGLNYGNGSSYYKSPFIGCTALTEITLPAGMTAVPKHAFKNMTSLVKVTVPEGVEAVGAYALAGCTALTTVELPSTLTEIGAGAFDSCIALQTLALPEGLTAIQDYAFNSCTGLKQLALPASLTTLAEGALQGCSALTKIEIPAGITVLNNYVLENCTGLTELLLPDTLQTITAYAVRGCTGLESVVIPDSVTSISSEAFRNCTKLCDVVLSANWSAVPTCYDGLNYGDGSSYYTSPFIGCAALSTVIIPDGMTAVPKHAFRGVTSLKKVTLPEGVESIGAYAFDSCTALETVELPSTLAEIGGCAFNNCISLPTVALPEGLTAIQEYAFNGCTGMRQLTLPASLTTLEDGALQGCSALTKIEIPAGITVLNNYVLENCTGLTELLLPDTLQTITAYAVRGCTSLESIVIPDSVTSISSEAFRNCTKLCDVVLSANWSAVPTCYDGLNYGDGSSYYTSPFIGCTALSTVIIPDGMTAIPKHAFRDVSGLKKIWIGSQVIDIGVYAFTGCTGLTIHGEAGSYAESYAAANSIPFSTEPLAYSRAVLTGTVTDEQGNGVAGVSVGIYNATEKITVGQVYTDETGSWSYGRFVMGHDYQLRFYHPLYTVDTPLVEKTVSDFTAQVEPVTVTATATGHQTTPEADFTYTVLNGTYCQITGYTGTDSVLILPETIDGYVVQSVADRAFASNETVTYVALPHRLETLGGDAFNGCTALQTVRVGNALTAIGNSAFSGCTALKNVELSGSVKAIYAYAFLDCTSLESIVIPDSVTSISSAAFENCTALKNVTLSVNWSAVPTCYDGLNYGDGSSYYTSPFIGCAALTEITLPAGMTAIPKHAFRGVTSLKKVTLPEGVESIGAYAFDSCTALETVELPSTLTEIGAGAFDSCIALQTLALPEGLTAIQDYAFNSCTGLKQLTLPASLTTLAEGALQGCSALTKIEIPTGITVLNNYVLENCTGLTELLLPDTLQTITAYAVRGCTGLESIVIPDSVTSISSEAFRNCTKLCDVVLSANWSAVPTCYDGLNYGDGSSYYTSPFIGCAALTEITLPAGMTAVPKHAFRGVTSLKKVTLPEGVESIGAYAFDSCTALETVELPSTLVEIGGCAFNNCISLPTVALPEGLTAIREYAFNGCTGMRQLTLPASLTTLEDGALQGCSALTKIEIPAGITVLNNYVLENCTGLTELLLPDTLQTITAYAVRGCTSLESIVIPDSVTSISTAAFEKCTALKNVTLSANWSTVPTCYDGLNYGDGSSYYASPFIGCTALSTVIIPDGMTAIPKHAFRDMSGLHHVVLHKAVQSIGVYAFESCVGLMDIDLPESITTIPTSAFSGCTGMHYLTLPDSLVSVGPNAFSGCKGLRSVDMGLGLKEIGQHAFYGCHGLVNLFLGSGVQTVDRGAFDNCINLRSISLPNNLHTIGSEAFADSPKVTGLEVPLSVRLIGENAFDNMPELVFYCSLDSYAATWAIINDIPVIDTDENSDTDNPYIDRQNSYYRINGDGVSAAGYLVMVAKYTLKETVSAEDISLTFNIPSMVLLKEDSLTVDGAVCTDYTYLNGVLTVPVTAASGTVRFLLEPLGYDRVAAYAKLNFHDGTAQQTEVLGCVYAEIPVLTIHAPDRTAETSVSVSGTTMPGAQVELYVNDSLYSTVAANRAGVYHCSVQLAEPRNNKKYTIRTQTTDSMGTPVKAQATTIYRTDLPVLEAFDMEYRGNKYDLLAMNGTRPTVTWASGSEYRFTVKLNNPDTVSEVYVTSIRNNVKKRMQAHWDEELQLFVAEGLFGNNGAYVPGTITLEYNRSSEKVFFEEADDLAFEETVDDLSAAWKNAEVIVNQNTEDGADMIIDLVETDANAPDYALHYNVQTRTEDGTITPEQAQAQGYTQVTDDAGSVAYVQQTLEGSQLSMTVIRPLEAVGDALSITDMVIDVYQVFANDNGSKFYTAVDKWGSGVDILSYFVNTVDTTVDTLELDRIRNQIENSNMDPEEKKKALEAADAAQVMNTINFIFKSTMLVIDTMVPMVFPWGWGAKLAYLVITKTVDYMMDELDDYFTEQLMILLVDFRWAIDPSGYVYDLTTGEKLHGAIVTAYWVPYDGTDAAYWDTKPGEEVYGVPWDASEFSQLNPLTTDVSGWYSWDVPEGWWRVRCEMPGYETTWSEWLPVPPPQMEVHIGMTALPQQTIDPVINGSAVTGNHATVTAPADGWLEGENTFAVSCGSACVVAISTDGGVTYTVVSPTEGTVADAGASFTADITETTVISVAIKGDVTGDGRLRNSDVIQLKAAALGKIDFDALLTCVGDVTGDKRLRNSDVIQLKAAALGKISMEW